MKEDELQSILNYLLTMHEVGMCTVVHAALTSRDLATRWQHNTTVLFRAPSSHHRICRARAIPLAKGSIAVPCYFFQVCQLEVLTEVVLFTVE